MPGRAKRLGEAELYQYALKRLAARARSIGELRQLLERRAENPQAVAAIIARLKENRYLDDEKYARSYATWRMENQRLGRRRVERDLRAHRVAPQVAQRAVDQAYRQVDERELLRQHLAARLRRSGPPQDQRKLASLYRHLLGAGFSSATIVAELRRLSKGDTGWLEELEGD